MLKLSIEDILLNISKGQCFEAVSDDYSFTLKIDKYVPYVCAAVHDGHQFRKELWGNCLHTEYERWYEEDPATLQMVHTHPIVIAGRDSRFEYDLNRPSETAVFDTAWGKKLWKSPLPEAMKSKSLKKHSAFYRVVHALIDKLEALHPKVLVFDMHSYNWKRWEREVPVWNIGTKNVDNERFGHIVKEWEQHLASVDLPNGIKTTTGINDTFQGNGHFLKYITANFNNTLVLATEISKIYCDELTGVVFPEVVAAVEKQLQELIPLQATTFAKDLC